MAAIIIDGKASRRAAAREDRRRGGAAEIRSMAWCRALPPCWWAMIRRPKSMSATRARPPKRWASSRCTCTLAADTSQDTLLAKVRELNADKSVHGILVQLPLPKHLNEAQVLDALDPAKDVDALTPTNAGLLLSGRAHLVSCTPAGVMLLLKEYVGDIAGKDVLVIGRSLLFGKPAAQLLLAANATVTMAHSRSRDLPAIARRADILVAAIGKPELVKADWIKPGAIVIDVGINRVAAEGGKTKLVGDVDYEAAKEIAGAITPVPGGVGAMTIVCLMQNTLIAACAQNGLPLPKL